MSDRVLHLWEDVLICVAVMIFAAYVMLCWAGAAEITDEAMRTDYAAVMKAAAVAGDVEVGRDAAMRRDAKIEALELDYAPVDFDELLLLSKIITAEAGSTWLPEEWKMSVGEVVLNRMSSPEFPDSVAEVIYQPGQYYGAGNRYFARLLPYESCVEAAWRLLNGERVLRDKTVVFQANFPQGSSVAVKYYDGLLGWTYFCRSAKPELYE